MWRSVPNVLPGVSVLMFAIRPAVVIYHHYRKKFVIATRMFILFIELTIVPDLDVLCILTLYLTSMQFNSIFQVSCRTRQTKLLCRKTGSILSQFVILTIPAKDPVSWNLLRAFAKFAERTVSFFISVCPSVRSHGTTWLHLDGF